MTAALHRGAACQHARSAAIIHAVDGAMKNLRYATGNGAATSHDVRAAVVNAAAAMTEGAEALEGIRRLQKLRAARRRCPRQPGQSTHGLERHVSEREASALAAAEKVSAAATRISEQVNS